MQIELEFILIFFAIGVLLNALSVLQAFRAIKAKDVIIKEIVHEKWVLEDKVTTLEQQLADKCHLFDAAMIGNAKMKHNIK